MADIVIQLAPHILAAVGYAALALHFWNTRWRASGTGGPPSAVPMRPWERTAIGGVLLMQAIGLYSGMFRASGMHFSFGLALSLIVWLAVLIYWLESFRSRMDGLQPLVLPIAAACAALPVIFPHVHMVAHSGATGFKLHFMAAMLAYSLFTLAAIHAVFMSLAEAALHRHAMTPGLASLPPLLTMEALLFQVLQIAFGLLTLALGSGVLFSEAIFGKAMSFDHKTVFAFISWGIFAILLIGRHFRGWRGRKALHWTLAGFLSLLLAYVGSRFVLEIVLGRA